MSTFFSRRTALLSAGLGLLSSCEIIENWPIFPPHGGGSGGRGGPSGSGGNRGRGESTFVEPVGALVINAFPLAGFEIYEAEDRRGDPRAGGDYIYLKNHVDAVALHALPVVDLAPSLWVLENAGIAHGSGRIDVQVNARLGYRVDITDFEGEVSLGRVYVERVSHLVGPATIESTFIFAARGEGLGGGVAHDVTIRALVNGVLQAGTPPVGIEARP